MIESPLRISIPSAPCPAAGVMISAGDHLPHKLRLAEAVQAGRSQNDGVVVSGFELAQPRIDIAPQRVNV